MRHPMRIELTRAGLQVYLANYYTTLGAKGISAKKNTLNLSCCSAIFVI